MNYEEDFTASVENEKTYEPDHMVSFVSEEEYENWKNLPFKQRQKVSDNLGSIVLLTAEEAAKAEGFRAQAKQLFGYLFRIQTEYTGKGKTYLGEDYYPRTIAGRIEEEILDMRKQFEVESIPDKVMIVLSSVPLLVLGMGHLAAITGKRTMEYYTRLREAVELKQQIIESGLGPKLEEYIGYAGKRSIDEYDYRRGAYSEAAPFIDALLKDEGGKQL